jgi:hypothetical protein
MSYIFIFLFLAFIGLFVLFLNKSIYNLNSVNLLSVYFYFHLIYIYIGIGYVFINNDWVLEFANLTDKEVIWSIFLYNCLSLTLLAASAVFSRRIIPVFKFDVFMPSAVHPRFFLALLVGFLICSLVYVVYISAFSIDQIVLFNLDLSKSELDAMRSAMGADFKGKYHWYEAFMRGGLSYVLYCTYILFLSDSRLRHRVGFYVVLAVTVFSFVSSGEKGSVINVIIGLLFCKLMFQYKGKFAVKVLAKYFVLIVFLLYFIFWAILDPHSNVLQALFYRLFIGFVEGLYYHVELIPSKVGFILGATFPNPGGFMPYEPVPLARDIYAMSASHVDGVTGSFPTIFWAEAYANYGMIGVALLSVFVGVYLGVYNGIISRFTGSISGVGFYVWSCVHYSTLAYGGLSWIFFDVKFLVVATMFYFVRYYEKSSVKPRVQVGAVTTQL